MIYIVLALLAGVCIVLNRVINYNLATKIGVFQGTFFNYIFGLLFSLVLLLSIKQDGEVLQQLFFSGQSLRTSALLIGSIPWWAFLGGLVGVAVVALSTYITPKISAFYLTIFIFIGQLFIGGIIDYLTLNIWSIGKVVGGILVLLGLTFNLLLDKKD